MSQKAEVDVSLGHILRSSMLIMHRLQNVYPSCPSRQVGWDPFNSFAVLADQAKLGRLTWPHLRKKTVVSLGGVSTTRGALAWMAVIYGYFTVVGQGECEQVYGLDGQSVGAP